MPAWNNVFRQKFKDARSLTKYVQPLSIETWQFATHAEDCSEKATDKRESLP